MAERTIMPHPGDNSTSR